VELTINLFVSDISISFSVSAQSFMLRFHRVGTYFPEENLELGSTLLEPVVPTLRTKIKYVCRVTVPPHSSTRLGASRVELEGRD
jgi:hypothetical protein